jgi:hypothetical protein
MARLFTTWARGANFALLLGFVLGMAAALSFLAVACAISIMVWAGVPLHESWVQPGEVDRNPALTLWKISGVLWVPWGLHWGAPLFRGMITEWAREDEREALWAETKKTGSSGHANETNAAG